MFKRHDIGEQALLVHIYIAQQYEKEDLKEFESLVHSAGIDVVNNITVTLKSPQAKYFVGQGKAEEIAEAIKMTSASVILFNHSLTPSQERNLEQLCQCRVIDRTGLILDIFAQRARTYEGKLQVELAQLNHLSTRLVRGWTHLERQKGGIGLRGPGETQLETDRRLLKNRIKYILSRLEKVEKQRRQNRQARAKADLSTLSLVGYTNAGKSTLFNTLTQANVYAADQLFATLDPTLRRIKLDDVGEVVLADTVGFIRHLPHDLVAAFKATLQEIRQATLLIHVVDCADTNYRENIQSVDDVLQQIAADTVPVLIVMNKIDRLEDIPAKIERNDEGIPVCVWLSAQTKAGINILLQALKERLIGQIKQCYLNIPAPLIKLRSKLYQAAGVESETINSDGSFSIRVRMPMIEWNRLCKQEYDLLYLEQVNNNQQ